MFCLLFFAPSLSLLYTPRLYPNCAWDDKQIRRLIGDGKLAARLKGTEVRRAETETECPICFLNYAQVNKTKCCQASLCTECYLQVRPPKEKIVCPFCHSANLAVTLQQKLSAQAIRERQAEEQRAQQAAASSRTSVAAGDGKKGEEQAPGFGSSLAMDENVAIMRKRSSSMSDTAGSDADLSSLAMTVDERQALEAQLRTQQQSPLIQRMQQEELERAFRNEREYLEQNAGRPRRTTGGGRSRRHNRDWNRLIQALEDGGGIQSMDDLAMLETAMRMASMEQHVHHRHVLHHGDEAAEEGGPSPLRRRMLDSRAPREPAGPLPGSGGYLGGSALATQLIMRGMTEEEQLAMAIAASLAESNTASATNTENNTENSEPAQVPPADAAAAQVNDEAGANESAAGPNESSIDAETSYTVGPSDAAVNDTGTTQVAPADTVSADADVAMTENPEREANFAAAEPRTGPVDLDMSLSQSADTADLVEEWPASPETHVHNAGPEPPREAPVAVSYEADEEPQQDSATPRVESEGNADAGDQEVVETSDTPEALAVAPPEEMVASGEVEGNTGVEESPAVAAAQTSPPVTEFLGHKTTSGVESTSAEAPIGHVMNPGPTVDEATNQAGEAPIAHEVSPEPAGAETTGADRHPAVGEATGEPKGNAVVDSEEVVEEAEAVAEDTDASECKSTEEFELPDEDISEVPPDSILPQESKDKSVETLESSGMSYEA